ncbi:MAG TPA: metallophosphoesterase [Gemmatimonadetes bacterium]|nr:metallophosphoesterase [Gemmatimonadota bacterium]
MLRILHGSDLQMGRPFRPRAAKALRQLAFEVDPNLIVISGDLTQRAKVHEFQAAWKFLEALPQVPLIVTPGNHDVPLYRFWERLLVPYRSWNRTIPHDLDSVTVIPGATVVGLNSASPWSAIVGGRLTQAQLRFARQSFDSELTEGIRVLVTHHHFVCKSAGGGGRPIPAAPLIINQIEEMEVDVVLSGHLHRMQVAMSRDVVPGKNLGVPLITAGTATSRRGRGEEKGTNSVNVLDVMEDRIKVTPYLLRKSEQVFEALEPIFLMRRHMSNDSLSLPRHMASEERA